MKKDRLYGCHVSAAGGLEKAVKNGMEAGANSIQIHPSPPQMWRREPFKKGVEEKYLELLKDSDIRKVFFHAIYLINLATPDPQKFKLSKASLVHELELCARIKADGVIVHVGSNKDQKTEQAGFKRAAQGINSVLKQAKGGARLLLEVAAGSGKVIGDRMEELRKIYDMVGDQDRVGFALDSQHMWASGYDFQNDLESIVKQVKRHFGLRKVWAIHLNDSKTELGSRKDRHENLGKGKIGLKALTAFVNHPSFRKIPIMLETPALKTIEGAKKEVKKLKSILKN